MTWHDRLCHVLQHVCYILAYFDGLLQNYRNSSLWSNEVYLFVYYVPLSWWHHRMETFSVLLAICAGISPITGEFPARRPVTRSFDVFFDLRLNKWLSKCAGDLRSHRAHYDVTVMLCRQVTTAPWEVRAPHHARQAHTWTIWVATHWSIVRRAVQATLVMFGDCRSQWRHVTQASIVSQVRTAKFLWQIWLTHRPWEIWMKFVMINFEIDFSNWWLRYIVSPVQCATFPIDRGPDLGKNWVRL